MNERTDSIASRHRAVALGATSYQAGIESALQRADEPSAANVFTHRYAQAALAAARHADALVTAGAELPALAGLPVTVKDLFDVAGEPTEAGSVLLRDAPAAAADAPAVARLRRHGAAITGKTNMSEFAFSGVGANPHLGTPRNPADARIARIPGGSSSGAAVSVGLGLAVAGLGSDTGGSLRIPAALCGLVGYKGSQHRVPLAGAFPLARSLDTVGAITRCVEDALRLDAAIADRPLAIARRPLRGMRFAAAQTVVLDALEPAVAQAYQRTLSRLSAAGARIEDVALAGLAEVTRLNAPGGLSPIEAYAVHRERLAVGRERYDPRVARRLDAGASASAADYLALLDQRRDWIARMAGELAGYDALICPTVPIVAPEIATVIATDEAFFRTNGLLLRNTFLINFLDGCAWSLPCHPPGELPVGLMLASVHGDDARLAAVALAVEAALVVPAA
ncbi:MAG: amidase [Burkholderiaceae bacterium]